ncbi:unnamed protein product [Schistosoma haematobium]|nr:unnamed protein product [Schistosoma haematobium]
MQCWSQWVLNPTRGDSILDLIFSRDVIPLSVKVYDEFESSDHKIVVCALPIYLSYNPPIQKTCQYRDYKHADWDLLHSLNKLSDWDNFFSCNSLMDAIDEFYLIINYCLDSSVPLKTYRFSKPYEIHIPAKYRNKLKRLQNCYFKSDDFTAVAQITIFNQIKEEHRLKAINEELLALNTKSKVQNLTLLFNKRTKATRNVDIPCIQHNSTFIYDSKTMADLFSSIFADGVENISGYASRVMCVTSNSIKPISFTCMKINKAINTLKLSKGHGVDGISSFLYKYGGPDIPLLLLKLFTLSMETGSYPYCWKTAYIIPRYKSGDKTDMNNYRPINITPVISRIMEKIISDELSKFLLAGKFINDTQHGFLKNRSCTTCHFDFNLVYSLRSQGYLVLVLYLDISKAFGMVSNQLLIGKLASYGVRNPLLAWLDSFISNRYQIVKINSSLSNAAPVRSGVIQGIVLGPLPILVFINDICESFCVRKPLLYADDLKVVYSFSPHELKNMQNCISMELNKVAQWCLKWQLELNTVKCGWICFGDTSLNLDIIINGEVLSRLHTVVDLGLRYSQDLSFTEQILKQTSKSQRLIGYITRNLCNTESRILMCKVCARPLLEYCTFILSSALIKDKLRLESVQRRFTLRILGADCTLTYNSRCNKLGLDPLWRRRLKLNLIFFFKLLHKLSFTSDHAIQYAETSHYYIRNSLALVKQTYSKSSLYMNYFTCKFSRLWNNLPQSIRTIKSLPLFVRCIDAYCSSENALNGLAPLSVSHSTSDILGTLNV